MTPDKDEEERDDDDLDDEEGDHMAASSNLRHRDAGFNSSGKIEMLFIKKFISSLTWHGPLDTVAPYVGYILHINDVQLKTYTQNKTMCVTRERKKTSIQSN